MIKADNNSFEIKPFILLGIWVLFMCFCLDTTGESLKQIEYLVMLVSVCVIIFMYRDKLELTDIAIILLLGVMLRSSYVMYTAVWTRQHDVIDFGAEEGHAAYIEYIYHNSSLPVGDPRDKWAFFQPPLHHIVAAVWMKICNRLGLVYRQVQENVQALTLVYTSVTMFFSYFICKELKLKKTGMRIAMIIIAFHPAFLIMSGSINNDALSLMFSAIALYLVIVWYKKPSVVYIILLALAIGLSMFAKLSGGLIAPAVAVMFLIKFVESIMNKKKGSTGALSVGACILQYVIFAIIVFPLGIWWEIRNMIQYKMPFNYIPPVGEQLNVGFLRRLFDVRMHSVYPSMIQYGDAYDEYNVMLTMFKTSLFDDANLAKESPLITPFAVVLFIGALILAVLAVYATVKVAGNDIRSYVNQRKSGTGVEVWPVVLLTVYYLTMLAGYFSFAFGSSNYSAMNFRYITMAVVVEAIFLGMYVDRKDDLSETNEGDSDCKGGKSGAKFVNGVMLITYFYAVSSFIVYMLLGFAR